MKNVLVYGHGSQYLVPRLQKLGFGVVLPPENLMVLDRYPQSKLEGKVDVIIYRVCTCCPDEFKDFKDLSRNNEQKPIPIVIVRGGDIPGRNYLILGSVREDAGDDVLVASITSALKLTEEPGTWQEKLSA